MKVPIHNVLRVGMSIYILILVFGIYFRVQYEVKPEKLQPNIVQLIAGDVEDEAENENSTSKKFNTRPLIEDDDDSAKDLMIEFPMLAKKYVLILPFIIDSYSPYQREITAPPPKV